jgi:WD40 repeat protein
MKRWIAAALALVAFNSAFTAQETTLPVIAPAQRLQTSLPVVYQVAYSSDSTAIAALSATAEEEEQAATRLDILGAGSRITLETNNVSLYQFAYHPVLPLLITTSVTGEVSVWDGLTGALQTTVRGHESAPSLAFAPNGQAYATVDWSGFILWSGLTNEPQVFLGSDNVAEDGPSQVAFSPDGQYAAWVDFPATINVVAASSGEVVARVATGYDVEPYRIGFTPQNQLAIAYGTLEIWDIGTQQRVGLFITPEAVADFAFSPDGARLALLQTDGRVRLMDAASQQAVAVLDTGEALAWSLAWRADSAQLAVGLEDATILLFDL